MDFDAGQVIILIFVMHFSFLIITILQISVIVEIFCPVNIRKRYYRSRSVLVLKCYRPVAFSPVLTCPLSVLNSGSMGAGHHLTAALWQEMTGVEVSLAGSKKGLN